MLVLNGLLGLGSYTVKLEANGSLRRMVQGGKAVSTPNKRGLTNFLVQREGTPSTCH